MFINLLNYYFS